MDFLVPKLSATMESAKVLRWLKEAGQRVRQGEALVELETDKAAIEVEAPADGTLESILAPEGTELPIGAALGRLTTSGAEPAASASPAKAAPTHIVKAKKPAPAPTSTPAPASPAAGLRIPASPLARRLAGDAGIELKGLSGSGPGGRIRKRDILAALGARGHAPAARPRGPSAASAPGSLSPMRIKIAEAVALSRRTIPAFALDRWVEIRSTGARTPGAGPQDRARRRGQDHRHRSPASGDVRHARRAARDPRPLGRGRRQAAAPRAGQHRHRPRRRGGRWHDDSRAGRLGGRSLGEIARARREMSERVRTGRLIAADSLPASISLSNLGQSGIDRFEAIINPGQASILAVGRSHDRVIARGGAPVVAREFHLTFSVDHRLIDGRRGAEFLGALAERIEFGPWGAN